jgi:hypothetical protein
MYISPKFWFELLFFENHGKLNIKKFYESQHYCFLSSPPSRTPSRRSRRTQPRRSMEAARRSRRTQPRRSMEATRRSRRRQLADPARRFLVPRSMEEGLRSDEEVRRRLVATLVAASSSPPHGELPHLRRSPPCRIRWRGQGRVRRHPTPSGIAGPASTARPPPPPPSAGAASSHPASCRSLSLPFFTWCRRFIDETVGRRGRSGGKRGDMEARGRQWGGEGTEVDLKARWAASYVTEARVLRAAVVGRRRTRENGPPDDVIT